MTIDYSTAFAALGPGITSALTSALPIVVPVFAALVGLTVFISVLRKFGIGR